MTELKPCPFCGGNARLTIWTPTAASISCIMCGAHFNTYTEAEAIAAWNTRAYTNDEITLSGTYLGGLPIEDIRVFGLTLDEVRQMMKRDAERERTCNMQLTDLSSGSMYHDVWLCGACGEQVEQHTVMGKSEPPTYCPNCGAKVVDE